MTIKEAYDKGFRDCRKAWIECDYGDGQEDALPVERISTYDPPKEDGDNNNLKFLCARCGIGFYLPSGKCDHCNYDQPREDGGEPQEKE